MGPPFIFNTWTGVKTGGTTPAGVYTRTAGCDLTATRTVV
jgi:hypothetical protein